jgi:hypothetical protein
MTEHEKQLEHLREAVDRKSAEAREASETTRHDHPDAAGEEGDATQADVASPRDKSSGKGKKTADKWNQ